MKRAASGSGREDERLGSGLGEVLPIGMPSTPYALAQPAQSHET